MKYSYLLIMVLLSRGTAVAQSFEARIEADPETAAIGEPVEWVLTVRHPAGTRPRLADADVLPDESWVGLGELTRATVREDPDHLTTWRFPVLSLEPGERELPKLGVRLESGETVLASAGRLMVTPELAPEEDAARPPAGFQEVEGREIPVRPRHVLLFFALALCGYLALLLRRRSRRASAEPAPRPIVRLHALAEREPHDPEEVRELHFELSNLVRGAVEDNLENLPAEVTSLTGLTDEEWIEYVRSLGQVPDATLSRVQQVLSACGRVKYGHEHPTRFLVEETLKHARGVLTGLEDAA